MREERAGVGGRGSRTYHKLHDGPDLTLPLVALVVLHNLGVLGILEDAELFADHGLGILAVA